MKNAKPGTNTKRTRKDPVCGMEIRPEDAAGTQEHLDTTYYSAANTAWKNSALNRKSIFPAQWMRIRLGRVEVATLARCIRKWFRMSPAIAPNAAWRSSR